MGELWTAGTIAHGPDARCGGLQAFVNVYIAAAVQLHTRLIESDSLSVGHSANSDEKIGPFDHSFAICVFDVDAENFSLEEHFDSLVAEQLQERGSHVGVLLGGHLRAFLDHRHSRTETPHGLRQFKADVTAAHNDEMLWQTIEIQELNVRHRFRCGCSGQIRDSRARAQIEEYAVTRDHARASAVEGDLYCSGRYEAGRTHNQFGTAGLLKTEVALDLVLDHFSFATLDAGHIDGKRSQFKTEFSCATSKRSDLRAVNDVLAGQAGDIRA